MTTRPVAGPEEGVRASVGIVAGHDDVTAPSARGHDLAVSLESDGKGLISGTEVRGHEAPGAERRIETAVGVVASQRKDRVARDIRPPGHDELAVGLDGDGRGHVGPPEARDDDPPGSEARVEIARRGQRDGGTAERHEEAEEQPED